MSEWYSDFKEYLAEGRRAKTYNWEHIPVDENEATCFMSGVSLPQGIKAYRGYNRIEGPMRWPPKIWLSEAEFLMRRLKGQI